METTKKKVINIKDYQFLQTLGLGRIFKQVHLEGYGYVKQKAISTMPSKYSISLIYYASSKLTTYYQKSPFSRRSNIHSLYTLLNRYKCWGTPRMTSISSW